MHVLQKIAVQADNKEDAFQTVNAFLENELGTEEYNSGSWFDWYVMGGGRWNPNSEDAYEDDQSMTISYEEEPEKFVATINDAMSTRVEEFNLYRKRFAESNVDIDEVLNNYRGETDYSFSLYELHKMIDMLQGKWDFNSYFFDATTQSNSAKYVVESIDKGNKNWYLVFVDFHF